MTMGDLDLLDDDPAARAAAERFLATNPGDPGTYEAVARLEREVVAAVIEVLHGFDKFEAYFLLTQAGRVRLGNMVDPNYTVGARIDKSLLA